ncbi:uncharacterized protein L969DRAFT_89672 [Mixia osmundae IAM 14324]|nr:uncharacterized protein L969DRAFT_89672 [Mixia osmundae IAM 14324]KEI37706.1 hypothetical protein L969DRAFT_89672 [Mixia osmundae IAM 14324]
MRRGGGHHSTGARSVRLLYHWARLWRLSGGPLVNPLSTLAILSALLSLVSRPLEPDHKICRFQPLVLAHRQL